MAVLLDQFVQTLSDSGLMTREEVQRLLGQLGDAEKPKDGQEMATLLFRQGKLTKFQAQAVYRGKAKGLVLGDYVVLDEIGQGGMGQVYKAQHRRMKRTVALKILPAELTKSEEAVRRFGQEVEAAAKLFHPNIVTALDAGETKKFHFLVMEFVEGQDLEALVAQRGTLPVAEALNYTLQAARGLQYAHGEGVIHRDIKPSNLLLDKNGTVKILDMGLARIDQQVGGVDVTADRGLTQSGDVMGTVDYMSPEQAASTKNVDARTDIYSLGCTLFYLLNARPVYEGETLVERVMAHRDQPLPMLRKLRKDVPQQLDVVFRRMVAKKPEHRLRSMADVIAQLEKVEVPGAAAGGGGAPQAARPAAETRGPSRTVRSVSTPTTPKSPPTAANSATPTSQDGAPPPPSLTPRDRRPVERPKEDRQQRARRALEQSRREQKQQDQKQVWLDTVESAVHQQKRKARWEKIRRAVGDFVAGVTKWVLLVALIGGAAAGGYFVWQNHQRLTNCRQQVLTAVNERLGQTTFDRIASIEFSGASALQPIPETLSFEHALFQTGAAGRRQTATLQGQYHRTQGTVEISEPFRAQIQVEAVP